MEESPHASPWPGPSLPLLAGSSFSSLNLNSFFKLHCFKTMTEVSLKLKGKRKCVWCFWQYFWVSDCFFSAASLPLPGTVFPGVESAYLPSVFPTPGPDLPVLVSTVLGLEAQYEIIPSSLRLHTTFHTRLAIPKEPSNFLMLSKCLKCRNQTMACDSKNYQF